MKTLTFAEALAADPKTVQSIEEPDNPIDGVERFTNLTHLDVSGNSNVKAFGFLEKLEKLEKLYLRDMGLREIPSEVETLKNLHTLLLGKNTIASFSVLRKLPALVDLRLEQLGLRKLPDDVLGIKKLKILGLYNNEITSLSALKALPDLEKIYVGHNRLKTVPKELKKLKKLRCLDLSENWYLKNCDVVPELVALEELLICSHGDMERLPVGLFKMTALRRLEIYTHDRSAPDALEGLADHTLTNLTHLTILNSTLSALPESISEMKKLTHLVLGSSEQQLTNVDAIRDLPELKVLSLRKNAIQSLGEGISTLKNLETFTLSSNAITDISGLRDLPLLRELHVFSKIETLPESLGTLTALEKLVLSSNGAEVSFLENFKKLNYLVISGCKFEALPKSLGKTVRELTVTRDDSEANDSYLQHFNVLENLHVKQPTFTLPKMASLQTLTIRGASKIDFEDIGAATSLQSILISKGKSMTALPTGIANATQLRHLDIRFLRELEDISALGPLENLETLTLMYCKLTTLNALGAKPRLRKLELHTLPCTELEIIANFAALESLTLDGIDSIPSLPKGLSALANLTKVHFDEVDELKDISVLESCTALIDFKCEGDGPTRKSIAKVNAAIAGRSGDETPKLNTSYATFMKSMYKQMVGKEDASNTYPFPLWFDTPEILLVEITHFSWVDDYIYGDDEETKDILTNPESGLKPLAALAWDYEGCNSDNIDAYSEEFFLVDTESPLNPVFLWGHDSGRPAEIYKSFDAFLANLRDFKLETDDDPSDSTLTYLQYSDEKSSKFWQIKVEGNTHTVTYGKIGTDGQTKEKTFDDSEAAEKAAIKLIASKRNKGYGDV